MKKLVFAVPAALLALGLASHANADGYHNHHGARHGARVVVTPGYYISPSSTWWTWPKAVPWGAYQTTVTYGPADRRCVTQLVLLPNGFWRPDRRCEFTRDALL